MGSVPHAGYAHWPRRTPPGTRVVALTCRGFVDATGEIAGANAMLFSPEGGDGPVGCRLLALGSTDELRRHPAWSDAHRLELPGAVVAPALANAHAHLDLTHAGPVPHDPADGFVAWLRGILDVRRRDAAGIAESVRQGVGLLQRGGTAAVGDIAGGVGEADLLVPAAELRAAGMLGVSYLEFFGLAERADAAIDHVRAALDAEVAGGAIELGIQPHAPYTVSVRGYERAAEVAGGRPLCTHLAESPAERDLIVDGEGDMRAFLTDMGLWDEAVAAEFGRARSPVAQAIGVLPDSPPALAVHLNDVDDRDIEALAARGVRAAYCPRSSDYFGAADRFGPHRYRDLLAAGIPVGLGTDSVLGLPPEDVAVRGICVLDEARRLFERDGCPPAVLLEMLYHHTPAAIGLDPALFSLRDGAAVPGLIAVAADAGRGAANAFVASRSPIEFL